MFTRCSIDRSFVSQLECNLHTVVIQEASAIKPLQQLRESVDEAVQVVHQQSEAGDLLSATASCSRLEQLLDDLNDLLPEDQKELWDIYYRVARNLAVAVFAALDPASGGAGDDSDAEPNEDSAELCWRITHVLDAQLRRPITVSPWVHELHNRLLIRGAQIWSRLGSGHPDALQRSAWMFARLAARLDPCPPWVEFFCLRHGVTPEPDPQPPTPSQDQPVDAEPVLPNTEAYRPPLQRAEVRGTWEPGSIAADVIDWVESYGETSTTAELGLTYLPEGPLVSRDPHRLELNLAPMLEGHDWWPALQEAMSAFLDPLKLAVETGALTRLGVRDINRNLHGSMAHLWRVGEQFPLPTFFRLNRASAVWSRLTGPGHLGARHLPDKRTSKPLGDQALVVQLDATELAVLQSILYQAIDLEHTLVTLSRDQLTQDDCQRQAADWWWRPEDPQENLRRLYCKSGFYATAGQEMQCLRTWANASFRCLSKASLWSNDPIACSFFLPVAQALFAETSLVPEFQQRMELQEIYRLMARQEVLYVGPHGSLVLEQHRSGRAFRLFHDQVIEPYGLRVVNPPESWPPNRPEQGFTASLHALIRNAGQAYQRKPFQVLLADCGAYRLPLLDALHHRYGVMGIAVGLPLAAVFGVDAPGAPRWAADRRRTVNWRPVAGETAAPS